MAGELRVAMEREVGLKNAIVTIFIILVALCACAETDHMLADSEEGKTFIDRNQLSLEIPPIELQKARVYAQQVNLDLLMQDVYWLADDLRQGRESGTPSEDEVGNWIQQRFYSLGLEPFDLLGLENFVHSFKFSRKNEENEDRVFYGENIMGVLRGTDNQDEYVLVSAHYDHLGNQDGTIYNGADDDATGVAAMLEIARIFSGARRAMKKSILFIAFSGEELGALGSKALCKRIASENIAGQLTALNMEVLGAVKNLGRYINVWDQSDAKTIPIIASIVKASEAIDIPVDISGGKDLGSDALALLNCDVAATTMDVGGGSQFYENHPHYHSPDDDPQNLDQEGFYNAVQVATLAAWILVNDYSR